MAAPGHTLYLYTLNIFNMYKTAAMTVGSILQGNDRQGSPVFGSIFGCAVKGWFILPPYVTRPSVWISPSHSTRTCAHQLPLKLNLAHEEASPPHSSPHDQQWCPNC